MLSWNWQLWTVTKESTTVPDRHSGGNMIPLTGKRGEMNSNNASTLLRNSNPNLLIRYHNAFPHALQSREKAGEKRGLIWNGSDLIFNRKGWSPQTCTLSRLQKDIWAVVVNLFQLASLVISKALLPNAQIGNMLWSQNENKFLKDRPHFLRRTCEKLLSSQGDTV